MKPILLFIMKSCPYCQQALQWMEELKRENPDYAKLDIKVIDENLEPNVANQYDYYYVPTYYLDGVKVHEGVATKEGIQKIFENATK